MPKLFSFFVFLIFSCPLFSQEIVDYIGIPEVNFGETKLVLAESSQKSKTLYIQDYIPEDSRLEDAPYTISIYFFNKNIDAKEATYQKTGELDTRQETDKHCSYNVTENPNGTEFIVDFFTSNIAKKKEKDDPEPEQEMADYNIYRFRNVLLGEESAFMIITYKQNNIGDTKYFIKSVGKSRNKLMENIITMTIPNVTLKK